MLNGAQLETYLKLPQLTRLLSVGETTIYRWIQEGHFPKPVRIGPNCSRWRTSDIAKWQATISEILSIGGERSPATISDSTSVSTSLPTTRLVLQLPRRDCSRMGRSHQAHLPSLCDLVFCLCRGFPRIRLGHSGFDPGFC